MRNLKRADVVKGTTFGGKYSTGMLDATTKHKSVTFQCTNLQTGKSLKVLNIYTIRLKLCGQE